MQMNTRRRMVAVVFAPPGNRLVTIWIRFSLLKMDRAMAGRSWSQNGAGEATQFLVLPSQSLGVSLKPVLPEACGGC